MWKAGSQADSLAFFFLHRSEFRESISERQEVNTTVSFREKNSWKFEGRLDARGIELADSEQVTVNRR